VIIGPDTAVHAEKGLISSRHSRQARRSNTPSLRRTTLYWRQVSKS